MATMRGIMKGAVGLRRAHEFAASVCGGSRNATAALHRAPAVVRQGAALRSGVRAYCTKAADSLFDSVDKSTFVRFASQQTNLIRREDGRKVAIIPMQHIASQAFYDSVLEEVTQSRYYLVLGEGVMRDTEELDTERQTCLNFATHATLREQLAERLASGSFHTAEEEQLLFEKSMVPYESAKALDLVHQELHFKPRLFLKAPLKYMNSDVTQQMVNAVEDPEERRFFVVHKRSEHCAKVLRAYLDEPLQEYPDAPGADTIAVCWGMGHSKDFIEDLLVRGFEIESEGPSRSYGWDEKLYNDVSSKFRLGGFSYDSVLSD
eukprot:TRINITY_DN10737_c0_g1_i1.p1 TRINITY_DN10737_c0_g1~~TRINITY_DN10737_c0_g1_i1.p1  ORF type:complete len:345 (+),score=143.21 TRINITY_DN10737_c0_g1_i1:77-1036(+)